MYADNEFLIGLANKLSEISENTIDTETQIELGDLAESLLKSCR
jgi:hypothetical protein